jgi:putative tricarboxylic transport membrane protein
VTCIDGHQMALQGRAGPALGISAFGSFIAGTFGVVGLIFLSNLLADVAILFGPAEYFSLMCLGMCLVTYLTQGSILKALALAGLGLFLSLIGQDVITGQVRFTFGLTGLIDGVGLVPFVIGLFGISEVLINLESLHERHKVMKTRFRNLFPTKRDWQKSAVPIGRGTLIGFFLGILPGGGGIIASFVSYAVEKKFAKHPENFGKGAIEGVAAPESANNAASSSGFIPLFSLGIPSNVVMAMLFGAFMIHGLRPGPLFITENPEIFWGTVASMYVGNAMLLVLNLPLIGVWVQILKVPYRTLFPLILLFCFIGTYSVSANIFDLCVMLIFGFLGYFLRKLDYELAPMVLAFVLGPMLEGNLRQALILSEGSLTVFLTRPLSVAPLFISLFMLLSAALPFLRRRKSSIIPDG